MVASDQAGSLAAQWVAWELQRDEYGLDSLRFAKEDVVVDIGAHVGIVSILLAKRWPGLRIIAYEPFPANIENCRANLEANSVSNVELVECGVSADRRPLSLATSDGNSGGASALALAQTGQTVHDIPSVTLDDIFRTHHIDRCALLKIDCEGMEYEILSRAACLNRVDRLVGEFHTSATIARRGWSPARLAAHCADVMPGGAVVLQINTIAD